MQARASARPAPVDADERAWVARAVREIENDFARSADTHLLRLAAPPDGAITLYLKDETTHPTGSLKHRLARSLFLYALCNGWIRPGRPVIEASSGSTAISEAYFARLIGAPFIAVVPRSTVAGKVAAIEHWGGRCHFVDTAAEAAPTAARLAQELGGHFIDQFTYAERATDWRGNNNIAESLFAQMAREEQPWPDWIVVGAGTGGTAATIGRYVRYRAEGTRLCVVDPERSAFFDYFRDGVAPTHAEASSVVEGVGRPRVEASFVPSVIDRMTRVPDAASVAGARWLSERLGRTCGPSTGMNVIGVVALASELRRARGGGVIATLLCDPGERYAGTIYDDAWVSARGLDLRPWTRALADFATTGVFAPPLDTVRAGAGPRRMTREDG